MAEIEPEKSHYDYLHNTSITSWTWEFTRRNPAYHKAWKRHLLRHNMRKKQGNNLEITKEEALAASRFGLLFFH